MSSDNHIKPNHNPQPTFSAHGKESEPFAPKKQEVVVHEVVEHEVKDPQIQPHVEVRKDVPEIPPDLKKLGITSPAASSFQTYKTVKLPLDDKKLPVARQAQLNESIRWLAELTQYIIDQSQGSMRYAHENIVKHFLRLIKKDLGK